MRISLIITGLRLFTIALAQEPDPATLVPFVHEPLPLGSIKPEGWLRDQLQLMGDGLAGHMHEFYRFVQGSPWLGGTEEYSSLNEAFSYWFNGIVPLAYSLDDERLKEQVRSALDFVLNNQDVDGWIGPERGSGRNFWGRIPFILGMMQLVEADPAYKDRILGSLDKFVNLANSMLQDDYRGLIWHEGDQVSEGDTLWGRVRFHDLMIVLEWLYEKQTSTDRNVLKNVMQRLVEGSRDWAYWFSDDVFIKTDLNLIPEAETSPLFYFQHGVNLGQGLKSTAVVRRFTRNDTLLEATRRGYDLTFKYHSAASGAILADERIAGLTPYYASETCTLVETMYSLSYMYQALGDNKFADKTELVAFNALPVQLTPDWWARQYVAEPNAPFAKQLDKRPFWNVGAYGTVYGLELNYPCCTANHPQGYPKFLSAAYVKVGDNGLAHALLSPATVSTTLASGKVDIKSDTKYPFDNVLTYTITSEGAFDFYVRHPEWADATKSTVSISGGEQQPVKPDSATGLHKISLGGGATSVTFTISEPTIVLEQRANDTVAVHHGALVYALKIGQKSTASTPRDFRTNQPFPNWNGPAGARDYILENTSEWNVAIDTSTLQFHSTTREKPNLPNPLWETGVLPTWITAQGCLIDWPLLGTNGPPDAPPALQNRACKGEPFEVTLEPLGAAKLHMLDIPTISLSRKEKRGTRNPLARKFVVDLSQP